jgi:hypothetical protein
MRARALAFVLVGVLIVSVGWPAGLRSQAVSARLEGIIQDQTQAVIPGVSVIATNTATNISYNSVTNEAGRYVFVSLPPATYSLTAELPGFKKAVHNAVLLQIGDARTVNLVLQPGDVSEKVTVTAETPLIDLTTAKIGSVVEQRQVVELPLNGRNAMMLFYLQAGTNPKDIQTSQQQSGGVDGLAPNTNNIKVEGIFSSNPGYDYSPANPNTPVPQEAVGEYRVTTSGALADAGRGSGAQVAVFLKSGTNEFHGSVFEFNRNTILNANDFFNNRSGAKRPDLKRNQFGFSLGGPIVKNRTFFFGTVEWQRQSEGVIQNLMVYTPTMRQGIFRYNTQGANSGAIVDSNGNPRVPLGTIDLLTIDPTRQGMDTVFLPKLLAMQPAPNNYDIGDGLNTAGHRFTSPRPNNGNQWLFKIDHELNGSNHISIAYSRYKYNNPQPQLISRISPEGFIEFKRALSVRLLTRFSPTLNNEFSFGGNLRQSVRPITNTDQETAQGNIQLTGLGNGNINTIRSGQNNPANNFGFSDSASWVKSNHTISFGGELWYEVMNRSIGYNQNAGPGGVNALNFPVLNTDIAYNPANIPALQGLSSPDRVRAQQLTNDLTGSIGIISQTFFLTNKDAYVPYSPNYQQLRQLEGSLFVQDIWKLRQRLSINAGLRYEMLPPGSIANGAFGYPMGGAAGALGIQGPTAQPTKWGIAPNNGKDIVRYDRNNFGPHLGFSWDPFGKGSTTISSSYGIAYDRSMMVVYGDFSAQNYGAATTVNLIPFTRLSDPNLYKTVLPIPAPQLFADLGFTRDSRAYAADPGISTPYVQSWNLRIAQQIGNDWKVEAAYVGNHAVGQWRAVNFNQVEIRKNGFLDAFKIAQRNLAQNGNPTRGESLGSLDGLFALIPSAQYNLITTNQAAALADFLDTTTLSSGVRGGLVKAAGLPNTFFRFNPQVLNLNIVGNRTHSTWNAMKLSLNRRLQQGVYAQANYTFAKGLTDYITQQQLFEDYRDNANMSLDKAVQRFDSTHTMQVNGIFELPFGKDRRFLTGASGLAQALLGGWQLNGIYQWTTGRPLQVTTGRFTVSANIAATPNFTGSKFDLSDATKAALVTVLAPEQKAQFSNPGPGEAGDLPRWSLRGPGYANVDASMFKKFAIPQLGESAQAQLRVEFFNALNHPQFGDPNVNINSGSFGTISSTAGAAPARIGQLALKILF